MLNIEISKSFKRKFTKMVLEVSKSRLNVNDSELFRDSPPKKLKRLRKLSVRQYMEEDEVEEDDTNDDSLKDLQQPISHKRRC